IRLRLVPPGNARTRAEPPLGRSLLRPLQPSLRLGPETSRSVAWAGAINVRHRCLSFVSGVFSSFMAGETILVVDDAPVSLKLAATVLRSEGYKVHLACSAEEALMTLRTMVPRLLLVDLQLPNMNGLELPRHLRQDPRTREMLIVALTASVMAEAEQLAYDAGCDGFIAKPIDTRSLGRRLRRYLDAQSATAPATGASPGGPSPPPFC